MRVDGYAAVSLEPGCASSKRRAQPLPAAGTAGVCRHTRCCLNSRHDLRVFGVPTWVHVPKALGGKLQDRAQQGRFVPGAMEPWGPSGMVLLPSGRMVRSVTSSLTKRKLVFSRTLHSLHQRQLQEQAEPSCCHAPMRATTDAVCACAQRLQTPDAICVRFASVRHLRDSGPRFQCGEHAAGWLKDDVLRGVPPATLPQSQPQRPRLCHRFCTAAARRCRRWTEPRNIEARKRQTRSAGEQRTLSWHCRNAIAGTSCRCRTARRRCRAPGWHDQRRHIQGASGGAGDQQPFGRLERLGHRCARCPRCGYYFAVAGRICTASSSM
jgi:hypothetical protein